MQLTPHFSAAEFCSSDTAARLNIDNDLPLDLVDAARDSCEMLERIRAALGNVPIIITSGYRCIPLNRAIGSKDSSDHVLAMAADFRAPSIGTPLQIAQFLADRIDELQIGQLINEFPGPSGWVHVSTRTPQHAINRVITITAQGTNAGVHAA